MGSACLFPTEAGKSTQHVWLDLLCTSTSAHQTVRLMLTDSQVNCVHDLQLLLQSGHRIPACDQHWRYHSQTLNGEETLKSLYFRSGDTFEVSYLATAAMEELDEAIENVKQFRSKPDPSVHDWQYASNLIERIAFDQFLPWKNAGSLANRHYFYQQGGLDVYFDTFRYVQKKRLEIIGHGDDPGMTFAMLVLEIVCLELLWNFSETGPDRRLVMHHGGLDMAMESLVRSVKNESGVDTWVEQGHRVADVAVGCIVQ